MHISRIGGARQNIQTTNPGVDKPEDDVKNEQLPITCPICGNKNEFPVENLKEGGLFQCPNCRVKLTLHGHMWEEIQSDISNMRQKP